MCSQMDPLSNITHVRGLYSIDESIPISKFVYKRDQSYLYYYQKKKNANQIRRNSFKTMNIFEPVYYVKMMEYQQIQQKVKYHEPYSFDIETLAKDSSDLNCPHFSRYSGSKNLYSSSLNRLSSPSPRPRYMIKKKKSHKNKSQRKSQKRIYNSRSFLATQDDYYYNSSPIHQKNHSSFSLNNSKIEKDPSYKRKKNQIKMMLLKKFYKKWYLSWCRKKSMMMSQINTNN